MQAPLIDKRSYDDLVAQTSELAGQLSGWQPQPDGPPDAGQALIGVFGRFAQLVIERLNRAPDQNYLAFLNLIGAAPAPPRVARVPLTFHLATGSPVDATVPAGTLAAAPPLNGGAEEVVFETEHSLVVTRVRLQAVYVSDTEADTYSDRTAVATATGAPFAVFTGDQPSLHQLFLAADPLLTQPGAKDITLSLATPDPWQWQNWPVSWAYWDGDRWQPVAATAAVAGGNWQVMLPALPALTPSPVNEIQAGWLRAQLGLPLSPGETGHQPDSVAIGARPPQDFALPWSPFPADSPVQRFYLSAGQPFSAAGAQVTAQVQLSTRGAGPVTLDWAYQVGDQWLPLGQSRSGSPQSGPASFQFHDGTQAFTQDGQISFYVPMSWPVSMYRTRRGRWLRVTVSSGQYTTAPEAAGLSVDYDWQLPRLGPVTVTVQPGAAPAPVPVPAAYCNQTLLDLSKDFYPLGQQPQFNDTFYVACPDNLAIPGADLTLSVTMTNPPSATNPPVPVVHIADKPQDRPHVVWEVSDGSQWYGTPAAYSFTDSGQVRLTLPASIRPVTVNGEQRFWLRGRLAAGGYGSAASYTQNQGTFSYTPANFAPPVVKSITVTSAARPQPPAQVTACLSYNDFSYADQLAAATGKGPQFTPFTPTADSDPALYLGFDQPFGQQAQMLFLDVEPPLPEQVGADQVTAASPAAAPRLTWEYAGPDGWRPLGALDETMALGQPGLVSFVGPADLTSRSCFGQDLYWLRLRWPEGELLLPPQLCRVLLNTTWAAQVTTVTGEILGSGNGDPGQSFPAAQTPVQPGQQVMVREPQRPAPAEEQTLTGTEGADAVSVILDASGQVQEVWVRWHAVPDFYQSGPRDRHYTVDPLSGVVQFGDGTYGLIPPIGQGNIRMTYRNGGGAAGNRASAAVVQLKSSVPYIDGVTNYEPAQGGADTEPISRLQDRGPRVLRHRDRAVAAVDLEDLALAASAEVAIAVAIGPVFNPYSLWLDPGAPAPANDDVPAGAGIAGVVIVPDDPGVARPTPSLVLLRQVTDYLQARCPATATLWVAGPEWISVSVTATVVVTTPDAADPAGAAARTALDGYLHPLTGGPDGQGWGFSGWPRASELSALLEAVPGVDHVGSLSVSYLPETSDPVRQAALLDLLQQPMTEASDQPEREQDRWSWLDRALVYSGQHHVSVALG